MREEEASPAVQKAMQRFYARLAEVQGGRRRGMADYWYTVEYDENSIAWLVDDTNTRMCLEHGMRLYVAGRLATITQVVELEIQPTAGREGAGNER